MVVLHRRGNSIVTSGVFQVEISQAEDGSTTILCETDGGDNLDGSAILGFLDEAAAAEQLNTAVDPGNTLKMIADLVK